MLLSSDVLDKIWTLRRGMGDNNDYAEMVLRRFMHSKSNEEYLASLESTGREGAARDANAREGGSRPSGSRALQER